MEIEKIFTQAKKILLRKGSHAPLLIIETTNQVYMLPVHQETWNSRDGRIKSIGFYLLGYRLAHEEAERAEDITQLLLVNEVWFAETSEKERAEDAFRLPSTRPDRKEAIMVLEMKPEHGIATLMDAKIAEIVRAGGTLDLVPMVFPADMWIRTRFFHAFLEGMKQESLSQKKLTKRAESFCFREEQEEAPNDK